MKIGKLVTYGHENPIMTVIGVKDDFVTCCWFNQFDEYVEETFLKETLIEVSR